MTPILAITLASGLLIALLVAKLPVGLALIVSGALGLVLLQGADVTGSSLSRIFFETASSYALIIIPMFIIMGIAAQKAGVADQVFSLASRHLERVPGGLALATIVTCAAFAAVSGSSAATVATIGPIAIREMQRHGYRADFSAGLVAAAGTLGVLIPPSLVLVIYGIITQESIGQLLIAGIIPGLLSALIYAVLIVVRTIRSPNKVMSLAAPLDAAESANQRVKLTGIDDASGSRELWAAIRISVLFVIVVGGVYLGVFTATESAAVGAAVALLMVAIERPGGLRNLPRVAAATVRETSVLTSMIFLLLLGSSVFTFFLVLGGGPQAMTEWIVQLTLSPTIVLLFLLLLLIPLGMFLDGISLLVVAVPLIYPPLIELGFDGIWLGVVFVKMIEIGIITPPVGLNAYVVAGVSEDVSVEQVFRGVTPFYFADIFTVGLLIVFPQIVLWLPGLM